MTRPTPAAGGTRRTRLRRPAALVAAALLGAAPIAAGAVGAAPAAALDPAAIEVPVELRQGRVLLVRPERIDVVEAGRVLRVIPIPGVLDLARLPRLLRDDEWATWSRPGVLRLQATVAQRPGSRVEGSAPALTRLELVPAEAVATRIIGTRAELSLTGVKVEALTRRGRPAPPAENRSTVHYGHGSQVTLRSGALHQLGSTGPSGRPALEVGGSSSLRMTGVRVTGATTGVRLDGVGSAVLDQVVVEGSREEGIAVNGGSRVTLLAVTSRDNGGDGIAVRGPVPGLRIAGRIVATGNGGAGLELTDVRRAVIRRVSTAGNAEQGVHVRSGAGLELVRISSEGDRAGVSVIGSRSVRLTDVTGTGSAAGIVVKEGAGITVDGARITGARDEAVAAGGRAITLTGLEIDESGEGVVVPDGASRVRVEDSSVQGERTAIRASAGAEDVRVRHVVARSPGSVAVRMSARGGALTDVRAEGSVGLDLRADTAVRQAVVDAAAHGVRVAEGADVSLTASRVTAREVGVSAGRGAHVVVQDSTVRAHLATDGRVSFRGGNQVSPLPIRWIAIAACTALGLALLLEVVRKLRERGDRAVHAPLHVLNRR